MFTNGYYIPRDAESDTRDGFSSISFGDPNTDRLKLSFKYFITADDANNLEGAVASGSSLTIFYLAWNINYLYIELKTGNTVSWSIVYGIELGLDG